MKSVFSYFKGSLLFTLASVLACGAIFGPRGAFIAFILGVMETSLSVDNAVVNATVLKGMNEKDKKWFLTWGMAIAVFGMRFLFPILIVWATSPLSLWASAVLPFQNPQAYADTLTAAHINIAGFGGAFLLMVFFNFLFDQEKEHHWVPGIEKLFQEAGGVFPGFQYGWMSTLTLMLVIGLDFNLPVAEQVAFGWSAIAGMGAYLLVQLLGNFLGEPDAASGAVKSGIAGLLYLEMLDASFSFDGVVGAFALSNNIIQIALGLGIGAMFVRSLTILVVDKGTLDAFKYLEHGAFWSIFALAMCMFLGTMVHISEVVTGLSAAVILGLAIVTSIVGGNQEVVEA